MAGNRTTPEQNADSSRSSQASQGRRWLGGADTRDAAAPSAIGSPGVPDASGVAVELSADREERVRQLKSVAAQRTADVANRLATLAHVLDDRERALAHHRLTLARAFAASGARGLERPAAALLAELGRYPASLSEPVLAGFAPAARELLLRVELPRPAAVPAESGHRYLPSRGEVVADPRKPEEFRVLYRDLVARFVLRTLDYAFAVTPPELVDVVVLDGRVRGGEAGSPCLVAVRVLRALFEELDLDGLDPAGGLALLGALVSAQPFDLVPARSRPDGLVEELDLAVLLGALLEAMGYGAAWFRSVGAEVLDVLTVSPEPGGGLCLVRARRTDRVVPVATVRALLGAMERLDAARGMYVTTSWFSEAGRECARLSGRIQLVDGAALRRLAEAC